jgi:Uma2 family endonuclease
MGKLGIFHEDDRVELLDGEIYKMTPIGPQHAYRVSQLQKRFELLLGSQVLVSTQNPVRLPPAAEPAPDVALLRLPATTYRTRLPEAKDILLLVEVADSSLQHDRDIKLPIYARAGIPEVWIVNIVDRQLEVYRKPRRSRYGELLTYDEGVTVAPLAFPESRLDWWS